MSLGNASVVRSTVPDQTEVRGVWTGGGAAANCTKASADASKGIASINYNAATGKYRITFTDVGQQVLDATVNVTRAAGAAPISCNVVRGSFSAANKTLDFEAWAVSAGAHALIDLLTTDKAMVTVVFTKNSP